MAKSYGSYGASSGSTTLLKLILIRQNDKDPTRSGSGSTKLFMINHLRNILDENVLHCPGHHQEIQSLRPLQWKVRRKKVPVFFIVLYGSSFSQQQRCIFSVTGFLCNTTDEQMNNKTNTKVQRGTRDRWDRAPRSLSPQLQMPIFFYYGLDLGQRTHFHCFLYIFTTITVAAWLRGEGRGGGGDTLKAFT
jgi:hypothetical protein